MPEKAPVVRVRSAGQISNTLEMYADLYRERFEERDVRWVYDPKHKPELSSVLGREAQGYELVTYSEIGQYVGDEKKEQEPVRVGDLVLMSIPAALKAQLKAERDQLAKDQLSSVDRKYYQDLEDAANAHTKEGHSRPGMTPMGRAAITSKEFSYDIEQRRGEQ